MTLAVMLLALALPLAFAAAMWLWPRRRDDLIRISPLVAVPALAIAIAGGLTRPAGISWLLLGTELGADPIARLFLLFTSLLWLFALVYAQAYTAEDPQRHRFFEFLFLVIAGNFGVLVSLDVVTFYASFALMTFAAYGFIVHTGDELAFRAGRIYIAMSIVGEFALLSGLVIGVSAAGSLHVADIPPALATDSLRDLAVGLLLAGFGIKAGLLGLHVWLPLAHPVAPTPASAVLSGVLIKAGLFGWISFLPLGEVALPTFGLLCAVLGLTGAFYGVAAGIVQPDAKTNLAYSSVSQMGIVTVALGIAFAAPAIAVEARWAIAFYALHHGLVKGGLFLGVGVAQALGSSRPWWLTSGLVLGAASMTGVVLTSGFLAKEAIKEIGDSAPTGWALLVSVGLPLTQTATTLLMLRFLDIVFRREAPSQSAHFRLGLWLPWIVLLLAAFTVAWLARLHFDPPVLQGLSLYPAKVWSSSWPVLLGLLLAGAWWAVNRSERRATPMVPPGDLLVMAEWAYTHVRNVAETGLMPRFRATADLAGLRVATFWNALEGAHFERLEVGISRWSTTGVLLLVFVILISTVLR